MPPLVEVTPSIASAPAFGFVSALNNNNNNNKTCNNTSTTSLLVNENSYNYNKSCDFLGMSHASDGNNNIDSSVAASYHSASSAHSRLSSSHHQHQAFLNNNNNNSAAHKKNELMNRFLPDENRMKAQLSQLIHDPTTAASMATAAALDANMQQQLQQQPSNVFSSSTKRSSMNGGSNNNDDNERDLKKQRRGDYGNAGMNNNNGADALQNSASSGSAHHGQQGNGSGNSSSNNSELLRMLLNNQNQQQMQQQQMQQHHHQMQQQQQQHQKMQQQQKAGASSASMNPAGGGAGSANTFFREQALRADMAAREMLHRKAALAAQAQAANEADHFWMSQGPPGRNPAASQMNAFPGSMGGTTGSQGSLPGGGGAGSDMDHQQFAMYANLRNSEAGGPPGHPMSQFAPFMGAAGGQGGPGGAGGLMAGQSPSSVPGAGNMFGNYPRFPGAQACPVGMSSGMAMNSLAAAGPNSFMMPSIAHHNHHGASNAMPGAGAGGSAGQSQSLSSLLLQLQAAQSSNGGAAGNNFGAVGAAGRSFPGFSEKGSPVLSGDISNGLGRGNELVAFQDQQRQQQQGQDDNGYQPIGGNGMLLIPPCDEERVAPFSNRPMYKLGMEEDPNWLSEFHCFVRSELIEVFRASHEDCKARNNAIAHSQVGIRCRFCAHISSNARAGRSSAFPSSLRQIYQSFTMMLRDHFGNCEAMPRATQDRFLALKDKPSQGATDSKRYWVYSAMKIGLADSRKGIIVTEQTRAQGAAAPPFGTSPEQQVADDAVKDVVLITEGDRPLISEFLFLLMSQSQLVRLTEAERVGNRRSLRLGLPGFGCRHCCDARRLGLCRMFPARRRTLPSKVSDLYDHLKRCTVCPDFVKEKLEGLQHQMNTGFHADQGGDREFFDRVWNRLGHSKT